jgi:hypothetical protein
MSSLRVELANPHTYSSPKEYIEEHLVPVVTELHRITNELLAPGATSAEEWAVDMVPMVAGSLWQELDQRLFDYPKHVIFDGSEYFTLPPELLRAKQLKVQLVAVVYCKVNAADPLLVGNTSAEFRLVRGDGTVVDNSLCEVNSEAPTTLSRRLPFGTEPGCIEPEKSSYTIQARSHSRHVLPVCRRLSLSFVYI